MAKRWTAVANAGDGGEIHGRHGPRPRWEKRPPGCSLNWKVCRARRGFAASGNTAASVTVTSLTMAVQLLEYVESVRQTAEPSRGTSRTDLSNLPYVFLQIILSDQNAGVLRPRLGRVWLSTIGTQLQAQDWEWFLAMNRFVRNRPG